MKFLFFILSVGLVTSCGKKSNESAMPIRETLGQEESAYGRPTIGYQRSVKLNSRLAYVYEELSIDPAGQKEVLGEMPFYLFLNEDNSMEVNFYSQTDLKKVGYLDLGKRFETTSFKNLSDVRKALGFVVVPNFERSFTYGEANPVIPEQDMLNKVFVIETEVADLPYIGRAQIMFWVTCEGGFRFKDKDDYQCGQGNLVFNYKLLDYELVE